LATPNLMGNPPKTWKIQQLWKTTFDSKDDILTEGGGDVRV
jgi:hypothetical protein